MTYRYGFLMFVAYKSLILPFALIEHGNIYKQQLSHFYFELRQLFDTELCHVTWQSWLNQSDTQ